MCQNQAFYCDMHGIAWRDYLRNLSVIWKFYLEIKLVLENTNLKVNVIVLSLDYSIWDPSEQC